MHPRPFQPEPELPPAAVNAASENSQPAPPPVEHKSASTLPSSPQPLQTKLSSTLSRQVEAVVASSNKSDTTMIPLPIRKPSRSGSIMEDNVPITCPDERSLKSLPRPSLASATTVSEMTLEGGGVSGTAFDSADPKLIRLMEWKYSRFTPAQKWRSVVLVSSAAVIVPLSTNIYYPALITIQDEFQASATLVNTTVTCYILLIGFAPLFWSAIADAKGRKITYTLSLSIFLVTSIATAFSSSIQMLLGLRIAQAIGGSSVLAVGAGTISDLFAPAERGTAMAWYILGPQIGPLFGPLLGGVFTQYSGWRSIFWFLIPLWYDPDCDPKITTSYLMKSTKSKLANPLATFAFLKYPPIMAMILNSCIIYMIAYCLATSLARDYQTIYGFNALAGGLVYGGMTVGNLIGTVLAGKLSDRVMNEARRKLEETLHQDNMASVPEERLKGSLLVSWAVPIGLLIHGWCLATRSFWFFPIIGQFIFGLAQMAPFVIGNTYLVDCFPGQSASAMALNNAMRSIFGSLSALFVTPLEEALGPLGAGYMFTMLGACFMIAYLIVFFVWRYGEKSRMKFHRWSVSPVEDTENEDDVVGGLDGKVPVPAAHGVMYYGQGIEAARQRVRRGSIADM
ncbi:hypothetical protein SeLEV6574_g06935 [Synchytrium endobioticum]|uniref:Major facilitator superfamily (MFS) profile domain-containing protein n=1 Tax=Synchytrium endobioticum TaxID=286115 RepID=A0A507CJG4_9FUNG|nr:hypothetical protein SeLEV6574_g06935 [Synchytrium endobioticum]